MTVIVMICALVFPIVFLIQLTPAIQQLIASASFAIAGLISLMIFFAPKLLLVVFDGSKNSNGSGNAVSDMTKPKSSAIAPQGGGSSEPLVAAASAMKNLSPDEQVAYCKNQITLWQALLIKVGDNTSGSNSQSSSQKASEGVKEERWVVRSVDEVV